MNPRTIPEQAIWYAIVGTYGFWLAGALYVLAPALGWLLVAGMFWSRVLHETGARRLVREIPGAAWGWVAGMLAMALALLMAHFEFSLGVALTAKSLFGWAKGWALLAVFVLIGCLQVRPEVLFRAACVLCAQTLLVMPVAVAAYFAGLPEVLYVSPLQAVGGPGPEFFDVALYSINPENGAPRWRLFTPWGPALGFVGTVYFFLALADPGLRWRAVGVTGAVAMIVASGSRLGLITVPAVLGLAWVLARLAKPATHYALGLASVAAGLLASPLLLAYESALATFHAARPASSRVRETLARIALERWADEAPAWGHGVVERGPHLVEYMPIGSHHTWYGLLFVKGLVGLLALALPFAWTLYELVRRAQRDATARTALQLVLVLAFYSFGENLEILAYLFWPALVLIGIVLGRAPREAVKH